MAHINLLPWREQAIQAKQREFMTVLVAIAVFSLLITFLVGQFYQSRVTGQNVRNQYLQNEITKLDMRIGQIKTLNEKKSALEKRMGVIEQLQRSRNVGTQVLDEIAKIVPTGIYIISLEKIGNSVQIIGKSESNNHLANMIRAIERSELFTEPTMDSISTTDAESKLLSDFKMQLRIKGLKNDSKAEAK